MGFALSKWMTPRIELLDSSLRDIYESYLGDNPELTRIIKDPMRYSSLERGKRIRPLFLFSTAQMYGVEAEAAVAPACSLELIHCYSLVHDDLPVMDDDDIRRGQPSCHKKFDEARAILAGDALQSLAFEVLAYSKIEPDVLLSLMQNLTKAGGRMVLGQALDVHFEDREISIENLQYIHVNKTGALVESALIMGSILGRVDDKERLIIKAIGENLGLAFQIYDDILDAASDIEVSGKPTDSNRKIAKNTYVSLLDLEKAKREAQQHYRQAENLIRSLPYNTDALSALGHYVINRDF